MWKSSVVEKTSKLQGIIERYEIEVGGEQEAKNDEKHHDIAIPFGL